MKASVIPLRQSPTGSEEESIVIATSDGALITSQSYGSSDGEHGFGVEKAAWNRGSKYFVYSLSSSGGHQAWHFPTDVIVVASRKVYRLDDLTGLITDPDFSLLGDDRVQVECWNKESSEEATTAIRLSELDAKIGNALRAENGPTPLGPKQHMPGTSSDSLELPNGYRFPVATDYTADWQDFRESDSPPNHVQADFNGDDVLDDAWILLGDAGTKWGLFVFLGATDSPRYAIALDASSGETPPQSRSIHLVAPGRYETACGKGYWECKPGEPEWLSLNKPAIDFVAHESASAFLWWDDRIHAFVRTQMSD